MSSQISTFKLDAIRKSLVTTSFGEKKEENIKTIGKLIYDAVVQTIPEHIMTMFTKEESDYINYDPKSLYSRGKPKYFIATSHISWWSSHDVVNLVLTQMSNDGINIGSSRIINSIHIDFPSPLPVEDKHINSVVMDEVKKKGALYEAIKEYIIRDKEIITLDNKIKCLFSSKRFYPGTLKNDFPEAYEVYTKMFKEHNSKQEPSTCDSIESIRATLLSNK